MFMGCGCHCIDERSEPKSVPSFGSQSASSLVVSDVSGDFQGGPCLPCQETVASAVYEIEWVYQGVNGTDDDPRPCCSAYKQQTKFFLYRQEYDPNIPIEIQGCTWYSRENAHIEYQYQTEGSWQCIEAAAGALGRPTRMPRFIMNLGRASLGIAPWEVRVLFLYVFPTIVQPGDIVNNDYLGLNIGSVAYQLRTPSGDLQPKPLPCLQNQSLTRRDIRSQNLSQGFGPSWGTLLTGDPQAPWRGAPCRQVLLSGFDMGLPAQMTIRPVPA